MGKPKKAHFYGQLVSKGGRNVTNETFKLIRLYSSMSQRDFAKHIGVSPTTVGLIEANYRPVSEYVRAKVAEKFDLNDDFLKYIEKYRRLSQI